MGAPISGVMYKVPRLSSSLIWLVSQKNMTTKQLEITNAIVYRYATNKTAKHGWPSTDSIPCRVYCKACLINRYSTSSYCGPFFCGMSQAEQPCYISWSLHIKQGPWYPVWSTTQIDTCIGLRGHARFKAWDLVKGTGFEQHSRQFCVALVTSIVQDEGNRCTLVSLACCTPQSSFKPNPTAMRLFRRKRSELLFSCTWHFSPDTCCLLLRTTLDYVWLGPIYRTNAQQIYVKGSFEERWTWEATCHSS